MASIRKGTAARGRQAVKSSRKRKVSNVFREARRRITGAAISSMEAKALSRMGR